MNSSEIQFNSYNLILENLTNGILVYNNEGFLVYYNHWICDLYNVASFEILGKTGKDLQSHGYIDNSFVDLVMTTKKKITYLQLSRKGKKIVNTAIPILDRENKLQFVIEQCQSLEDLSFYSDKEIAIDKSSVNYEGSMEKQVTPIAEFKSTVMENIYNIADNMATKNINILILGSSGTGKSQLAQRIHNNSSRKKGPFVTINCSTIPGNLIESELFGYMKGAFSGASHTGKKGLVEIANQGTLFLDEIGELPLELQSKLLQLVQDKTYLPIGGVQAKQIDTRIIAATNQDIPALVSDGKFREDLYYRLAVVTITMPPLKNRPEDILQLIRHFSNTFNIKHDTNISFSEETIQVLCKYSWPGNIREMEHLLEFLILNSNESYITPHMLPLNIGPQENIVPICASGYEGIDSFTDFLESQESSLINALYSKYNTSYKMACRLDISQSKANRLIRKYVTNTKN